MNKKSEMKYFKDEDVLHFVVSNEQEAGSIEITPNITAEINQDGELIGIEILNASAFIRDYVMEMAQAKILAQPDGGNVRLPTPRSRPAPVSLSLYNDRNSK